MVTLLIEHAVSDFATWQGAFDRFAAARLDGGVTGERVYRPVADPRFVVVLLDFPDVARAEAFRRFLTTRVWADPGNSPALQGTPRAEILRPAAGG
jgi:hypothetical protein